MHADGAVLTPAAGPRITEAEGRLVALPEFRMHVEEAGAGDPVVLVHGWPQHSGVWRRVVPLLAGHRRVVALDLRGFGASEDPGHGYDPDTFADDVLALLDALDIERAELVGHDWGGNVVLRVAERAPERCMRVLSIGSPHLWVPMNASTLRGAWRSWYAALVALPFTAHLLPTIISSSAMPNQGMDPRWADHLRQPGMARISTKLYRSYFRQIGHKARREGDWPPIRVLVGELEQAFPLAAALEGDLPAAVTTEVLPGADHWIPEQQPEAVAERVLAQWQRH